MQDINEEAQGCLNCQNPLCKIRGCPVETDIPGFIAKIKEEKFEEAFYILKENNIMSNICGIVCPAEEFCMGSCIKGIRGNSIKINELEDFVNTWAEEHDITYKLNCEEKNGIKVALVGGGPAGIGCAAELAKKGFDVTIFEREHKLGGVLRYGIPEFRLSRHKIDIVTDTLEDAGIHIKTGIEFGKDITEKSLKKQGYKAIFLGIGADVSTVYSLSEKDCNGIYKANEFLKIYNNGGKLDNLGIVAVIGGGNVAMDSSRASVRLGAEKVYILYRRDMEYMPARALDIKETLEDGVEIMYKTKVIRAKTEKGKIVGIKCIKTEVIDGKSVDIEGSEFSIKADTIIFAIGLFPDKQILRQAEIELDRDLIRVDLHEMTNRDGVFAGGDLIEARSYVCKAIQSGKIAAWNIDRYLIEKFA